MGVRRTVGLVTAGASALLVLALVLPASDRPTVTTAAAATTPAGCGTDTTPPTTTDTTPPTTEVMTSPPTTTEVTTTAVTTTPTTTTEPPTTTAPPTTTPAPTTTPPPPPPNRLPLLGASTADQTVWTSFTNQVGAMPVRRTFEGANQGGNDASSIPATFAGSRAGSDVAAHRLSMVSFKTPLAAFAAGSYDAKFTAYLNSIPAGHRVIVTFWHEPEDEIKAGQFTVATWQAANVHAGQMIDATGRPELANQIILRGPYTISSYGGLDMYWAAGYTSALDYIGFDPYRVDGRTMAAYLGPSVAWARSHAKPVTVPEYGAVAFSAPGTPIPNRVAWLKDAWSYFKGLQAASGDFLAAAYFQNSGGAGDSRLSTSDGTIAEFKAEVAESNAGQG